ATAILEGAVSLRWQAQALRAKIIPAAAHRGQMNGKIIASPTSTIHVRVMWRKPCPVSRNTTTAGPSTRSQFSMRGFERLPLGSTTVKTSPADTVVGGVSLMAPVGLPRALWPASRRANAPPAVSSANAFDWPNPEPITFL